MFAVGVSTTFSKTDVNQRDKTIAVGVSTTFSKTDVNQRDKTIAVGWTSSTRMGTDCISLLFAWCESTLILTRVWISGRQVISGFSQVKIFLQDR